MSEFKNIGIIPARLGSGRFPNKPLKKILGMPMIGHVYKRAALAKKLDYLYVATYDQEIADYIEFIGGNCVVVKEQYRGPSGCVAAVAVELEKKMGEIFKNIIMIQGDEPTVQPGLIDSLVTSLEIIEPGVAVVNIVNNISQIDEFFNKDMVKVVTDNSGKIIWFFRLPSPYWQDKVSELTGVKIQTGIIGFTRHGLDGYFKLAPTAFEQANSVDMFRFLEHGIPIKSLVSNTLLYSVDNPRDLVVVEDVLSRDPLVAKYK